MNDRYILVTGTSPLLLMEEVNKKMSEGFIPNGGPFIYKSTKYKSSAQLIIQAMVKKQQYFTGHI